LNRPLREPLIPEPAPDPANWGARPEQQPYASVIAGPRAPTPQLVDTLVRDLERRERGLIVCGQQDDPELPAALAELAARLGYPILADPLSGLRRGPHPRELVLDAYDATLRDARVVEAMLPEVILRFGAPPTSKPLVQYLQRQPNARQVLVDGGAGWRDPSALSSDVLHIDARLLCAALSAAVSPRPSSSGWLASWLSADRAARRAIDAHLATQTELFEGAVFPQLASLLPDRATLYVGNSMPVRDLETFLGSGPEPWRCLANRGANGIDGVVSSALGASAVDHGPLVLVIGDISFYHDLNGLLAARRHGLDLLVVLMNNDGGGIFSFLPQADLPEHFETLFGTPHGLDFRPFVEGHGGQFVRVADWTGFASAVREGLARGGLQVVEVPTDRRRNVELHREVWRVVSSALAPAAAVG
jgi:2-succinyl-5-enolpyruvyl-6-hydroxy-3-cyclohexene-1-carboxylate synthase